MIGYSPKPLRTKLGIKPGTRAAILAAPPHYHELLSPLPQGVSLTSRVEDAENFIQFFVSEYAELVNEFPQLKKSLAKDGQLWISWPKQSSKISTDLNENTVREVGLLNGLVDGKVTVIDENWSALKFVYRVKDRK